MKGIITFDKDGKSCITRFDLCLAETEADVFKRMHENDVAEQIGEYLSKKLERMGRPNNKELGYAVLHMPKFTSRLDRLEIRRGKEWEVILNQSISKAFDETYRTNI